MSCICTLGAPAAHTGVLSRQRVQLTALGEVRDVHDGVLVCIHVASVHICM